ncbi:hypothetical protein [Methylobacterium komagatae]
MPYLSGPTSPFARLATVLFVPASPVDSDPTEAAVLLNPVERAATELAVLDKPDDIAATALPAELNAVDSDGVVIPGNPPPPATLVDSCATTCATA